MGFKKKRDYQYEILLRIFIINSKKLKFINLKFLNFLKNFLKNIPNF